MIGEVDTRFAGIVQKSLFTQSAIIATNHAKRFNGTTFQKSTIVISNEERNLLLRH